MRVLIAGSSGLIGSALMARLQSDGVAVRRLVRRPAATADEHAWQPGAVLDAGALDGIDAVINLAGASIGRLPWTRARRLDILQSRLDATGTLVDALGPRPDIPLLNASAVGIYGNRDDEALTETAQPGTGFLADVVEQWESATAPIAHSHRVVLMRTGLVLAREGALAPVRVLTQLGLGGPLGSGSQWWPWISLRDEVAAIVHLLHSSVHGPVNLVGPEPARMRDVGQSLARTLHRPFWLPAPASALRAALGGAADELLLNSQRVLPERLRADGFQFSDMQVADGVRSALSD